VGLCIKFGFGFGKYFLDNVFKYLKKLS